MNRITLTLKRPFIWLSRFRHRCGYGVHSPFAFSLITQVIYESTPIINTRIWLWNKRSWLRRKIRTGRTNRKK